MTKTWRPFVQFPGSAWIWIVLGAVIVIWLVTGLIFNFSRTWLSLMTLGTSIVTLFIIFLILNTRNRHTKILLLKLNQLERTIKRMLRGRHNGKT
jgi:low affinity Fe/Cu permease